MKTKQYPVKRFRLSEEVYEVLLTEKKTRGVSWNLLLKQIYDKAIEKVVDK